MLSGFLVTGIGSHAHLEGMGPFLSVPAHMQRHFIAPGLGKIMHQRGAAVALSGFVGKSPAALISGLYVPGLERDEVGTVRILFVGIADRERLPVHRGTGCPEDENRKHYY